MGERIIQQQMHAIRLARLQQPKAQEASIDISEPAGLPQQISLWLVPPDCSAMPPNAHSSRMSLVEVSSKLARQHKLPGSMEPHITIIGDVGLHAEEACSRLKLWIRAPEPYVRQKRVHLSRCQFFFCVVMCLAHV